MPLHLAQTPGPVFIRPILKLEEPDCASDLTLTRVRLACTFLRHRHHSDRAQTASAQHAPLAGAAGCTIFPRANG